LKSFTAVIGPNGSGRLSCASNMPFSWIIFIEINVDKTKYMLVSHHQNVGQNRDIKIANGLFDCICHSSNIWGRQ
jgi:hypothetical protein